MVSRLVVVVVALTHALPVDAQEVCGGDSPRWVLVTHLGYRMIVNGEDGPKPQDVARGAVALFLKECDIAEVERDSAAGPTRVVRRSFVPTENVLTMYLLVAETPAQICAAVSTCSDATAED